MTGGGEGYQVDIEYVRGTILPLSQAMDVAREVWQHKEQISSIISGWPDPLFERVVGTFMYRWGHAMGNVVREGEQVGQALGDIVMKYAVTEAVAAGLLREVPGPTPGSVSYQPVGPRLGPPPPAAAEVPGNPRLDLTVPVSPPPQPPPDGPGQP